MMPARLKPEAPRSQAKHCFLFYFFPKKYISRNVDDQTSAIGILLTQAFCSGEQKMYENGS